MAGAERLASLPRPRDERPAARLSGRAWLARRA
jgi:hypothetical protein